MAKVLTEQHAWDSLRAQVPHLMLISACAVQSVPAMQGMPFDLAALHFVREAWALGWMLGTVGVESGVWDSSFSSCSGTARLL